MTSSGERSAIIVGAGHNGLVAATLLARAGVRTTVLERLDHTGGATVSARPFEGVDVRLSRYSYLVSLFPRRLARELGIELPLIRRRISSYTPDGDGGLLMDDEDAARTAASMAAVCRDPDAFTAWTALRGRTRRLAQALEPTLLEPLITREQARVRLGDDALWDAFIERPIGETLAAALPDDLVRGVALTDALVGTFADPGDATLLANRCFLYHVIGGGTGDWDVPVGGMGAVAGALERAARAAGADVRTGAEVVAIEPGHGGVQVRCAEGPAITAGHVLCGAAPAVLDRLLGRATAQPAPEGSQLKLNMVLERLPRLRDPAVTATEAFAGTFHVNERASQLDAAHAAAERGEIPALPPLETYCHSLADPSIVGPGLRERGVQTLTAFAFHMPARLFAREHEAAKRRAVAATLASLNSVLAEPIEDCLLHAPDGTACLEARTPVELEDELALPGGNIFHRDLQWPFAEDAAEAGGWGTETGVPGVWLCGAGARRGGGVSGIPGHNAARAVLEAVGRDR